jgi:hypothetical protein
VQGKVPERREPSGRSQLLEEEEQGSSTTRKMRLDNSTYCGGKGWIRRSILEGGRVLDFCEAENQSHQCYIGGAQETQVKRTNHRGSARVNPTTV